LIHPRKWGRKEGGGCACQLLVLAVHRSFSKCSELFCVNISSEISEKLIIEEAVTLNMCGS